MKSKINEVNNNEKWRNNEKNGEKAAVKKNKA